MTNEIDRLNFRCRAPMSWTQDEVSASISEVRVAERFITKLDIRLDIAETMIPQIAQAVVRDAMRSAAEHLMYEMQPRIAAEIEKQILQNPGLIREVVIEEMRLVTRGWIDLLWPERRQ